jgi:hypothetical protein
MLAGRACTGGSRDCVPQQRAGNMAARQSGIVSLISRIIMTRTRILAFALALVAAAGSALAQDGGRSAGRAAELQKRFAAADKNGDGKLTKEEAQAGMPMVYKHFDEIDKAHGGAVSLADIAAFAKERRGAKPSGS